MKKVSNRDGYWFYLPLADGSCWRVKACHPAVEAIVEHFASICSMGHAPRKPPVSLLSCHVDSFANLEAFRTGHPDWIETGRKSFFRIFFDPFFQNSLMFFTLEVYQNNSLKTLAVNNINCAFQLQVVSRRNCAPCHCALVSINGHGAIIAGRGNNGKTTCATRIPKPHQALADDYAILFQHQGKLLAQAMPTWSNLINGNHGYWADCSCITEVEAIFFLKQSSYDCLEPINGVEAVANMNTALQDLLCERLVTDMPEKLRKGLRARLFNFAGKIVKNKPTHLLKASLHGAFWNEMEIVLN